MGWKILYEHFKSILIHSIHYITTIQIKVADNSNSSFRGTDSICKVEATTFLLNDITDDHVHTMWTCTETKYLVHIALDTAFDYKDEKMA